MVDTKFLREGFDLRALADERLGGDGEALRVIYGPTFHANVAITIRRVGELAELEIVIDGAAAEREMLAAAEVAAPLALLRRPINAWDDLSRDGLSAHGERWDGREQVLAHMGNPTPTSEPEAYRLLLEVLDFAEARPTSTRTRDALANVRSYLDMLNESAIPRGRSAAGEP